MAPMRMLTYFASSFFQSSGKKTAKTGRCFLSLQRNSLSKQEELKILYKKRRNMKGTLSVY